MITQPYNLNLIPGGVPVRVPVSQYDAGSRDITFSLYHGGTAFAVPAGAVVTCDGAKPDRKGFSYVCTAAGSTVTVTVTEQMTAAAGEVDCQITIRKDGQVLGSANFLLVVERAALPDGADISETEINSFTQIANQAAEAAQSAQEAVNTLDGKKASLDASTAAADTANTTLTVTTSAANTARTNLVSATSAANTARTNLTNATTAANTARDALSQPTADAQAAKTALDTANQTAVDNLEALNDSAAMAQKIPKVSPAVAGNLAVLKADGTLDDSGKKPGDFALNGFSGDMYHAGSDTALDALIDNVIAAMPEQSYKHIFVGFTTTEVTLGGGWYFFKIYKDDNNYVMLHGTSYNSGGKNVQRARFGGAWGAWEWVNPPMAMGTEYRTTERWSGAVVYTKLVDCGLSASSKTVSSGVLTTAGIIRDTVVVGGQPMTQRSDNDTIGITRVYSKVGGIWQIQLTAGSGIINAHTYVQMWYIK